MTPVLVVASLTLLASFLCSLFEAALYTITPARIGVLERREVRGARRLARLRKNVEEPIAAILTVNTVAHTVGASWCGAMVGEQYGSRALGAFAAVFTILVLAVTEIVPKSLGVRYADQLGAPIAWPIQAMIWSVWPIVWLAQRSMAAITGSHAGMGPSEDEVVVTSGMAAELGTVRHEEHRWVKNALRLDRVTAGKLRTPRPVVEFFPADTPIADFRDPERKWLHSRVPVTESDQPDEIVGQVLRRDAFDALLREPETGLTLRDLMQPIRFVPESMPAHVLLEHFVLEPSHMAAVVDEFGGFEGVVTLEDVLECLLGAHIVDEHDEVADLRGYARERAAARTADAERSSESEEQPAPESPPSEQPPGSDPR